MHLQFNPYSWQKVNLDIFYGQERNDLVYKLSQEILCSNLSSALVGGRRMGKTTLLRRLEHELIAHQDEMKQGGILIIPVYIETRAFQQPLSSDFLYEAIARLIHRQLKDYQNLPSHYLKVDTQTFRSYLSSVINSFTDCAPQVVFIFDEIEAICLADWGQSFFANWHSLLRNDRDISPYLCAVFSGGDEMERIARDIGSPLGGILSWHPLRLFSQDDTSKLMCEPIQYEWNHTFIEQVYHLSGGHPFLIQYIMHTVCSQDLEVSYQFLEDIKSQFLAHQRLEFQNWWKQFDDTARAIYARLAEVDLLSRQVLSASFGRGYNRSLSILAHTGVVQDDWKAGTVTIAGSLFKDWFLQFAEITVTIELSRQVDILLADVERRLRELLIEHYNAKYGSGWLQKSIKPKPENESDSRKITVWQDLLKRAEKSTDDALSNEDIIMNSDLGYLFDLIVKEWNDLSLKFMQSKLDAKTAKIRFGERKDHLVFVRNKLRHVREDVLTFRDLQKAQVFCEEILQVTFNTTDVKRT